MESGCRPSLKRPRGPGRGSPTRAGSIISISDLQSQHIPCCSRLTWSSDEFREWTHQNETILPDQKYFEQSRLMLIGYLRSETPGKNDKMMDGSVYLQDNTGALLCVFLHFKLEWLEHLSLFPSWIYVPQIGEGTTGYLEILEDPIQVLSGPEKSLNTFSVFYPQTAAELLNARPQNQNTAKVNVAGELARLTTVLCFNQKTFFFLFLKCFSSAACVPVVVQKTLHLVWHHALQLGHKYVLTDLKISCLKSAGQSVFRTSSSSCLLPYCKDQTKEQCLDVTSQGRSMVSVSTMPSMQPKSLLKMQKEEMILGHRKSKLISYTGTITQVLNSQAGLYELDNKHILCLAYQQMLNTGCGFRPGACIELRDVHLLEAPLPTISTALGACLHTTIVLKRFSAYSILHQPVNCFGNHYLQLLLQYNLNLSLYLYMVSLLEIFEQRFFYFTQHQKLLLCFSHHSQGLIEKFIVPILNSLLLPKKQERNFHAEILAEKHHCFLDQYQILEPSCQIPHFVQLYSMIEKSSLEICGPLQQLHSSSKICNVNIQELNCRLVKNYCILSAECFHPPLLLLGVLEYSSSGSLQLQDRSNSLPCIIFHKDCRPFTDTSLIGCLLQVNIFQLVTEQFPQNDFSSSQQPITAKHIKKKKRVYAQFYFEDVKVLHIPEKRAKISPTVYEQSSCDVKDSGNSTTDLGPSVRKAKRKEKGIEESNTREPNHFRNSTEKIACVSRLFLLIQKEGLSWRNYLQNSESKSENGQAMQLCFQATVLWMGKPKLCHSLGESEEQEELKMVTFEETNKAQQKVLLLFLKNSLHWFPFLHADHLYQLILPQCTDLDIFDKKCLSLTPGNKSNLSRSFFLLFPDGAYVHQVRQISQSISDVLKGEQKMFSIAEILSLSSKGSLVSFSGEIMERTLCDSHSGKKTETDACAQKKGALLPWNYTVKLRIAPAHDSSVLLDVYIQAAFVPYLWGLLPGAKILFRDLQCKISRFGNVYCVFIASSDVCVLTPPLHNFPKHLDSTPRFSVGYLSNILLQPPNLGQAQVTCHLTCILSLSMQWFCGLCNISTKGRPNECNNSSSSHTGMINATARILVEDGTSEVVVFCKNQQVQQVLGLSPKEWEVMQNHIRIKGSICIQHNEISTGARILEEQEDLLTQYLRTLCRSPIVCRSIVLAFRVDRKYFKTGSGQLRRFFCNELEFLSQIKNRPNLVCLAIQETI